MAGVQGCGAACLELWAAGQCQRVSFGGGVCYQPCIELPKLRPWPTPSTSAHRQVCSFFRPDPEAFPSRGGNLLPWGGSARLPSPTSPLAADAVLRPQGLFHSLHDGEQKDWCSGPDQGIWASPHTERKRLPGDQSGGPLAGRWGQESGTWPWGTCSWILSIPPKDEALSLPKPASLCALNSSEPVKAPHQTRQGFPSFLANPPSRRAWGLCPTSLSPSPPPSLSPSI